VIHYFDKAIILRELMIFSRQYDQPLNLTNYINCVYVLELPTLEPLFMSLLVFIVSIGVVLDI
jgi:hypothetical protein